MPETCHFGRLSDRQTSRRTEQFADRMRGLSGGPAGPEVRTPCRGSGEACLTRARRGSGPITTASPWGLDRIEPVDVSGHRLGQQLRHRRRLSATDPSWAWRQRVTACLLAYRDAHLLDADVDPPAITASFRRRAACWPRPQRRGGTESGPAGEAPVARLMAMTGAGFVRPARASAITRSRSSVACCSGARRRGCCGPCGPPAPSPRTSSWLSRGL